MNENENETFDISNGLELDIGNAFDNMNDGLDDNKSPAEVSQITASPPQGTREQRQEPRYRAWWKIMITIQGEGTHKAQVKDISQHGASVLVGRNLNPSTKVTLTIDIPVLVGRGTPKTVVVHGMIVYTIHDSENMAFRVGIRFDKFDVPSDRGYLEARLTNHHQTIREPAPDSESRKTIF